MARQYLFLVCKFLFSYLFFVFFNNWRHQTISVVRNTLQHWLVAVFYKHDLITRVLEVSETEIKACRVRVSILFDFCRLFLCSLLGSCRFIRHARCKLVPPVTSAGFVSATALFLRSSAANVTNTSGEQNMDADRESWNRFSRDTAIATVRLASLLGLFRCHFFFFFNVLDCHSSVLTSRHRLLSVCG